LISLIDTTETGCSEAMRGMFAARKAVFVDLLGWDVPVLNDQYEIDQFDNEHARYLILTDGDGGHLASTRLLPTHRPHILDSLFPSLCAGPVPRGRSVANAFIVSAGISWRMMHHPCFVSWAQASPGAVGR
jgi:N-acyl-L-homoserine lactone synthetase